MFSGTRPRLALQLSEMLVCDEANRYCSIRSKRWRWVDETEISELVDDLIFGQSSTAHSNVNMNDGGAVPV